MVLPERLPPYFAEKCNLYKPKRSGSSEKVGYV
jgi:hypothetical protein